MSDTPRSPLGLFADELRAARKQAGMSRDMLASKLNFSSSLIGMIETERRTPSRPFAERCDEVFETPGTFARLEARLRDLPFPASFRPWAGYEAEARLLRLFEHVLVPGLFQTAEYATAMLSARPNTTDEEVGSLVAARMARQAVLSRKEPPLLYAVLDEAVLHRPVGTADVMRGQLAYLADVARWPNVTFQLIPASTGAHIGLQGGFVIAELPGMPAIVFLDNIADGLTAEDAAIVSLVTQRFDALRAEALPRRASRDLIIKIAEERWTE